MTTTIEETIDLTKESPEDLISEQETKPYRIDEVAFAYFNDRRVTLYQLMDCTYAGYKIGAIYSFILGLIENYIGSSMNYPQIDKELKNYSLEEIFTMAKLSQKHFKKMKIFENTLNEIDVVAGGNLCESDEDVCPCDCECDWDEVCRLVKQAKKDAEDVK